MKQQNNTAQKTIRNQIGHARTKQRLIILKTKT